MLAAAGFVVWFFRNPERTVPQGDELIVSPADGRVLFVGENVKAPYTGNVSTRVCIFMSVLNVHVNRTPIKATVKNIFYSAGKFFVASLDKASEHNERNGMVLVDPKGREFVMVQVAGLVARRIVCYLKEGVNVEKGERIGLIRFGSRVDLYVPKETRISVKEGDRVKAGETVLGSLT